MKGTAAVVCALLGVPAGIFANLLIERVPDRQSLRPFPAVGALTDSALDRVVIVATMALFAGAGLHFGGDWVLPAYLVFFLSLVAITVIDFRHQIVPNWIVYPTVFAAAPLLALAALFGGEWDRLGQALLGATLALAVFVVIHLIQPAGMGFGDVRLSFVLGLLLGWNSLSHVFLGTFLGVLLISVLGIVLTILRLATLKDYMAFGPFLALGSVITVFAGDAILRSWVGG